MSIDDILRAFQEWRTERTPTDPLCVRQANKLNAVLAQCLKLTSLLPRVSGACSLSCRLHALLTTMHDARTINMHHSQ